jgi:hypothetical protein
MLKAGCAPLSRPKGYRLVSLIIILLGSFLRFFINKIIRRRTRRFTPPFAYFTKYGSRFSRVVLAIITKDCFLIAF